MSFMSAPVGAHLQAPLVALGGVAAADADRPASRCCAAPGSGDPGSRHRGPRASSRPRRCESSATAAPCPERRRAPGRAPAAPAAGRCPAPRVGTRRCSMRRRGIGRVRLSGHARCARCRGWRHRPGARASSGSAAASALPSTCSATSAHEQHRGDPPGLPALAPRRSCGRVVALQQVDRGRPSGSCCAKSASGPPVSSWILMPSKCGAHRLDLRGVLLPLGRAGVEDQAAGAAGGVGIRLRRSRAPARAHPRAA